MVWGWMMRCVMMRSRKTYLNAGVNSFVQNFFSRGGPCDDDGGVPGRRFAPWALRQ